jgi:hypothetical protein
VLEHRENALQVHLFDGRIVELGYATVERLRLERGPAMRC